MIMKIILVYVSPNSTTKSITQEFERFFQLAGHEVTTLNIGENENRHFEKIDLGVFQGADLIGIGCPVYHLTIIEPMERFLSFVLPIISVANTEMKAFVYLTYSGITTGKALSNAAHLLQKNNISIAGATKIKAPHFFDIDGYPDEASIGTVRLFCSRLSENKFQPIDWGNAKALFQKRKTIIDLIYPFRKIMGNLRRQPIQIKTNACIRCGKCANQCPVNAIYINQYAHRDPKKCIYCYHCTMICPEDAIHCNIEKLHKTIDLNRKTVGTETPQNDIFI